MDARITQFLAQCGQQGFGFWHWPSGDTTEVSALYIRNWGGHYTASECQDGRYYPAYYEVRLEELDFVVLTAVQLTPLLARDSPAAAIAQLREQAQWPRATEVAAQAGVSVGRINQLIHLGTLDGEKRGVEWYVNPASRDRWLAGRQPGRPRKS